MRVLTLAFCGTLLAGSIAAFLLYVSILSILSVMVVLVAMMSMFVLGLQVERQRRRRDPEIPSVSGMPSVQDSRVPIDARVGV